MSGLLNRLFHVDSILKNHPPLGEVPSASYLLKRTVSISWPSITEALLLSLVAFVDTLMVSTEGDSAVAAVGITNQPRMLLFALFFALQPTLSAIVARRRGEDRRDSANQALKFSLVLSAFLIILTSIFSVVFADGFMHFSGTSAENHELAVQYFRIIMGGMVFTVLTLIICSAQRGVGNTKLSMRTNLVSNLVNVAGNWLLIGGNLGFPALGVQGAAIATIFGQFCGFIMALISVLHPNGYLCIREKTGRIFNRETTRSVFKLWPSTLVEQLILRFGFFIVAMIVNRIDILAPTTNQIGMNFMHISFAFGDGLSVAAIALVGYSLGQGRSDLAKIYGAFCQRIGLLCSLLVSVVYIFFGRTLFSLFSDTEQVLRDGIVIMWLLCFLVLLQISQIIFSGCLRGAGDSRYITLVSLIGIGILRPLLAYLFSIVLQYGLVGAWAAMIVDQAIRLILTSIRFYRGKWANIKI